MEHSTVGAEFIPPYQKSDLDGQIFETFLCKGNEIYPIKG